MFIVGSGAFGPFTTRYAFGDFVKHFCHLLRDLFFFPFAHPAISVIINHVTGMEARISLVLKRSLDFSFKDNYEVSGFFLAVAA